MQQRNGERESLAILARINPFKKKESIRISDYLDSRLISFLDVDTRDDAINGLITLVETEIGLSNKKEFSKAVFYREQLVSTGIGMGVAVPHAKLTSFTDFFIVIGVQQKKGLEWYALDKAPVRLIFLIGGPEDRQTEYLQLLSLLTSAIRDIDLRKHLLNARTKEQILELFSQF